MANEIQELKFQVGEAWKGVYSSSTAYGLANVVQDPTGLSIYRSLKSGNVGHPLSNASWWFRIIDLSSIKAESDRIAALNQSIAQDEALRVAAEELRQQHEAERVAAETQRDEAEQARISAEQQRVNKESQREAAEQQRISAEQGRVSAESARVQAEQARVLAETLRANAEDQRAANEQNRVAAEQQRIERAEQDHQRAESDHATYVDSLGAFDISSYHATDGVLAKYADLTAALGTGGANIPDDLRKGGMSVKFVQSSDNNYVQYRLMSQSFTTDVAQWQGIDNEPELGGNQIATTNSAMIPMAALYGLFGDNIASHEIAFENGKRVKNINFLQTVDFETDIVADADWRCIVIEVNPGESYILSAMGDTTNKVFAILDSDKVVRGTATSSQILNGFNLVIPNNVKYLIVNDKKTGNKCYKYSPIAPRCFKRGDLTTPQLDTLLDNGTYKYGVGAIVIVNKYSDSDIRQVRMGGNSGGGMNIEWRTYNGSTWGAWQEYIGEEKLLLGKFTKGSQLNSKLETGIWQGAGTIVTVRRLNANTVVQWRIYNLSDDNTGLPHIEYRSTLDNGTTWGDWIDWTNNFITVENAVSAGIPVKNNGCVNIVNPQTWPVNNVKYHAANEADVWINPKTGFMYAVYPENDTTYYETTGRIGMSIFSMARPWDVKNLEVAKTGDGESGIPFVAYLCPIESQNKLRVFVTRTNNLKYGYRDFDLETETFGELHYLQYNGADLTGTIINQLLAAAGHTFSSASYVRSETLYNNPDANGYQYQVFSSADRNGDYVVIFKSNNNWETCEYVGVFPYGIRYNSIMDYLNGTFYFLYRKEHESGLSGDAGVYLTTTQDFQTYTEPVLIGSMDMRPDIFVRDNYVYLVVGDKRNQGQGFYRTNTHILKGTGSITSGYTKIVNVTDDRGTVNPRARLFGDDIHFLFSNSPIRLDKENGYYTPVSSRPQYQGKECECYLRIRMT